MIRMRVAADGDAVQEDPEWEPEDDQQPDEDEVEDQGEAPEAEAQVDPLEATSSPPVAEPARRSRVSWGHTVRPEECEEFDEDAFIPMPRHEPYRPVRLVPVALPEGEKVRVVGQYWADSRPERVLIPGHHCVVRMSVGQRASRVALDTGAVHSLARTSFVQQLRKFSSAREAGGESEPLREC